MAATMAYRIVPWTPMPTLTAPDRRVADTDDRWSDHRRAHDVLADAVRDVAGSKPSDDDFLTRREAEVLLESNRMLGAQAFEAHKREHEAEGEAVAAAIVVSDRERRAHEVAHDREHNLHSEKHGVETKAVATALEAVARERSIHAEAHERDHQGHQREHVAAQLAIDKAERATDQRFHSTNQFREQLNEVIRTLTTKDAFDTFQKDANRRFEEQRLAITNLEKGDAGDKGKGIGQGSVVAYIVTAVGVVGGFLGILIVVANFATGT